MVLGSRGKIYALFTRRAPSGTGFVRYLREARPLGQEHDLFAIYVTHAPWERICTLFTVLPSALVVSRTLGKYMVLE